jgi:hypothetical protein
MISFLFFLIILSFCPFKFNKRLLKKAGVAVDIVFKDWTRRWGCNYTPPYSGDPDLEDWLA